MKKQTFIYSGLTRRQFIRRTALTAGAASLAFPYVGNVLGANDRINVACIGCNGKGESDSIDAAMNGGYIVAVCDVNKNETARKVEQLQKGLPGKFSDIKQYQDYRKMFDEFGKNIDAVTVSTPDHHHGCAGIRALKLGKHVFCQKPLTQTVNEARMMRSLAKEKKLATQMGNQGSAEDGLRRAVEVIQAGVIGAPRELHVWSNRPIWPQAFDRPAGEDPVPANLDWDIWLGPAAKRPFKERIYEPFVWRGWYDFGTGALGDMACHTVNMPFRALKLGYPTVVECELSSRMYPETFPKTTRIRFEFPEREGLPPLKFWWYDGNPQDPISPLRPPAEAIHEIVGMRNNLPGSGCLVIGEKGKLFSPDDYGASFAVVHEGQDNYVPGDNDEACKAVPITLPRLHAPPERLTTYHMKEWFDMMKGGAPAFSNFEIGGYLAEIILLGCIALRVGEGKRMEWDGPNMKSPNLPKAAQRETRKPRRLGSVSRGFL